MGHYSGSCPEKMGIQLLMAGGESDEFDDDAQYGATSFQFMNISCEGMMFHQEEQVLPKSWVLLDNQLKVDVFCNKRLLMDVCEIKKVMNICCNAGLTRTNMVGELHCRRLWHWLYGTSRRESPIFCRCPRSRRSTMWRTIVQRQKHFRYTRMMAVNVAALNKPRTDSSTLTWNRAPVQC